MASKRFEEYRKELDKLNLKTSNDLENLVKPLIKEATKINAKKCSAIPNDSHLKSHFGGQPYFEKGEEWPRARDDFRDNCELEFVFQIYNEGNIILPGNIKLVQFYYDLDGELSFETDDGGWFVKTYENIHPENFLFIEKPKGHNNVNYCEVEYEQIKTLPDWEGLDDYCPNAVKLSLVLDDNDPSKDHYQEIVEKLIGEQDLWSQFGGYAHWLQRNDNPDKDKFNLLFQLDSEDNAGRLSWGDSGLVYILYDEKSKTMAYVLQCC
jgi:uncharacterized protein YwqG